MDIHSFNKKLSKISALAENPNAEGQFSSLERDLILSYIRELYEIVIDGKPVHIKSANLTKVSESHIHAEPHVEMKTTERQSEIIQVEYTEYEHKAETEAIKEVIKEEIKPAPAPIKIEMVKTVHEQEQKQHSKQSNAEGLNELFADEKVSDLSDKLGQSTIKDLTKSMGINEKIFTQQELFGNDQQHFAESLQRLNNCQNFEDAKQYLIENVIYKYDWLNENKIKKAITFIKLVKRKFV